MIMDVNAFIVLMTAMVIGIITIVTAVAPLYFQHVEDKRNAKERQAKASAELAIRQQQEADMSILINGLLRIDAAMDYISSRAGEQRLTTKQTDRPPGD